MRMPKPSPLSEQLSYLYNELDNLKIRMSVAMNQIRELQNVAVVQHEVTSLNVDRVNTIAEMILSKEDDLK